MDVKGWLVSWLVDVYLGLKSTYIYNVGNAVIIDNLKKTRGDTLLK